MKYHGGPHQRIEKLHLVFREKRDAIRQRLAEFAAVGPDDYFYELAYCLLTPQSSAINAAQAVEELKARDFLHNDFLPADVLADKRHYIRFHNTKARHLLDAKAQLPDIRAQFRSGRSGTELRTWLVYSVKGLGWKEASHFLRNVGYRNLAILDRHILKNLKQHGVLRSIPTHLTPSRYLSIERTFQRFAQDTGITMDELDLLFWSNETGSIRK